MSLRGAQNPRRSDTWSGTLQSPEMPRGPVVEREQGWGGGARAPVVFLAFAAVEACPRPKHGHGGGVRIDVDAQPPPPSAATAPFRRLRIAAHGTGVWRLSWASARPRAQRGLWMRCPSNDFQNGRSWIGECGGAYSQESGIAGWMSSVCACRAPSGLLERRLLQFLEWGHEATRDLRQLEFLRLITLALSSLDPEVWESLMHDSTTPKLPMQRIREEVLRRGLGVVGSVAIPREIWERYVPHSFELVVGRNFSGVGPPSDEAVVMLRALRAQSLRFPLPPGSPGPNGGGFAIPKTLEKCSLIVNLIPVNRVMKEKPEKFSLSSVEVLALLAHVARHGSSFFLPPFNGRARCLRPVWDVLSLPGGGGDNELCMCHVDLSCLWSLRLPEDFLGSFSYLGRCGGGGGGLAFRCLPFGWKYNPVLCQRVMERLMEKADMVGVLVLIYLDDGLVVGRGRLQVREQAHCAVDTLRSVGTIMSPKTTLEPVTRLVWLGKDINLGGKPADGGECLGGAAGTLAPAVGGGLQREAAAAVFGTGTMALQACLWALSALVGGLGPRALGTPPSAVYSPQTFAFYVRVVCIGVAWLVGVVPPKGVE